MIFPRSKEPERVEHRRPCEVDGSKAWYHGLIRADVRIVQPSSNMTHRDAKMLERAMNYRTAIPADCRVFVEHHTYAMVEYLDGSVAKVDPEQVRFTDV